MAPFRNYRSTPRRLERTYYLAQLLFWVAASLPMALSVLLMQSRGMDLLQIGMLMGMFSLTVVLFEFPSGVLADAIGRKRIALLAYGFMLAAYVALLFAFSFLSFLLAWGLMGIGRAFASGALKAWLIDGLHDADPEAAIQPALARAGTFELLGLTLGTLGGSYLPSLVPRLPADGSAVITPLAIPLLGSVVVTIILIAFVAVAVRETSRLEDQGGPGVARLPAAIGEALRLVRRRRSLLLLLTASSAGGFMLAGLETFWQPHFATLLGGAEGNTALFGFILAGCFFAGMVGNLASIRVSRWLGRRYALVAGLFQGVSGIVLVVLAFQTTVGPAVGLFWFVYLSRSVVISPHAALFNLHVPGERRSTLLSLESLVVHGGFFVGSVTLGYLAEGVSTGAAWTAAGTVMAASVAIYLVVDREERIDGCVSGGRRGLVSAPVERVD